jgi:hypothetical protein
MANAQIALTYSNPNWSLSLFRAGTAGSGGTAINTNPTTAEIAKNQKDFKKVLNDAAEGFISYSAANGYATGWINMIDTSGTFTFTSGVGGTAPVQGGGSVITTKPTTAELALNTRDLRKMMECAVVSLISDRAANG